MIVCQLLYVIVILANSDILMPFRSVRYEIIHRRDLSILWGKALLVEQDTDESSSMFLLSIVKE